jgi:glycerol-3-phosphate dehydrogenase
MQRDLGALAQGFDLLVVGAGAYGACIARIAALSGLRTAIIDKGDFGAATSRNSAKLLHGGLRYLQHFDLRRIRESMRAQRIWFRVVPHLVRPLRFAIPTYGFGTRGPAALAAGMAAFHALAADRNRGVRAGIRLPPSGLMSRRRLAAELPFRSQSEPTGGAYWHDGQMLDATRMTLECIWDAVEAGATAANHVECVSLLHDGSRVHGVAARDVLTGRELDVRARLTVNATGPWIERVLATAPQAARKNRTTAWTRNANLVTRRLFAGNQAFGVESSRASDATIGKSNRLFFASPWHGCTIIGTSHEPCDEDPEFVEGAAAIVRPFLDEIGEAMPGLDLDAEDVLSVHVGLTPAEERGWIRSKRSLLVDHETAHRVPGLVSVAGVKYTTAPVVAARTVRLAMQRLRGAGEPAPFELPARGAPADQASGGAGLTPADDDELAWAKRIYGTRADECLGGIEAEGPDIAAAVFRCRVRFGIRHEMVMRLSDALLRATDWAERGMLSTTQLDWCAETLKDAHGWSAERTGRELQDARARLQKSGVRLIMADSRPNGRPSFELPTRVE